MYSFGLPEETMITSLIITIKKLPHNPPTQLLQVEDIKCQMANLTTSHKVIC